jgi:N-carbamoylputrescine amidase
LKVTVCELSPDRLDQDWQALVAHVKSESSELVLLPEMPFYPWPMRSNHVDASVWQASVESHDKWITRLDELSASIVTGTRPVINNGKRLNEGFIREPDSGYRDAHTKYYLPNEEGFWEASWYERGEKNFNTTQIGKVIAGFLICSEIWFTEHARAYAKQGIHLLLCPRATPMASVGKWISGGRVAAVTSGAFCLSSSFGGIDEHGMEWAGNGWIIEPEEGTVLGLTSRSQPFLTLKIDLTAAEKAKKTYPRYILE